MQGRFDRTPPSKTEMGKAEEEGSYVFSGQSAEAPSV